MFIYQGKFNWPELADNETFTVIFPNGVVRANDPVYLFSQWTKDTNRVRKAKFFETIVVSDVKQLSKTTDISFNLSGARYNYAITTEQNYNKIKVDMSGRGTQKTFTLDRAWKPEGKVDHDAALRIWAGSITIPDSATDEQAILILPEDYKDGKPVISSWQWTKDAAGKEKTTAFKETPLKFISSDDKLPKFAFNNVHDFTCTWNRKTEKLDLEIKKGGKQVRAATLTLRAKVEPKAHSFDSDDLVPPTKKEVEFRLPQPQATLPRVLDPMPFPKTLLETLKHGAAFIEQAGYLTVQAQNKFTALDADYHKQAHLVENLKTDKKNLETEITSLTGERNQANATIKQLNDRLIKAGDEYQKKVDELNDRIEHIKNDERFDHEIINKLQEDLKKLYSEIKCLKNDLHQAEHVKDKLNHKIASLQEEIVILVGKVIQLEIELKVQKDANGDLAKKNKTLENQLNEALIAKKALQTQLAAAEAKYESTKTERDVALRDLTSTKAELDKTTTDLKAKSDALKETQDKLAQREKDLKLSVELVEDKETEAVTYKQQIKNAREKLEAREGAWIKFVDEYQVICYAGEIDMKKVKDVRARVEAFKLTLS